MTFFRLGGQGAAYGPAHVGLWPVPELCVALSLRHGDVFGEGGLRRRRRGHKQTARPGHFCDLAAHIRHTVAKFSCLPLMPPGPSCPGGRRWGQPHAQMGTSGGDTRSPAASAGWRGCSSWQSRDPLIPPSPGAGCAVSLSPAAATAAGSRGFPQNGMRLCSGCGCSSTLCHLAPGDPPQGRRGTETRFRVASP